MSDTDVTLFLLRHGEVASHKGDVPLTEEGAAFAVEVGRRLGSEHSQLHVLSGSTLRTRQTAEAIAAGATESGAQVRGPRVAFGLRNPDLYVAGQRVDMVSSFAAVAAQLEDVDEAAAEKVPFFRDFVNASDRIGWWLRHPSPPGDSARSVRARIDAFAGSLRDLPGAGATVVAVTHSPVLRSVAEPLLGRDPGEPAWVAGLSAHVTPERTVEWHWLETAP